MCFSTQSVQRRERNTITSTLREIGDKVTTGDQNATGTNTQRTKTTVGESRDDRNESGRRHRPPSRAVRTRGATGRPRKRLARRASGGRARIRSQSGSVCPRHRGPEARDEASAVRGEDGGHQRDGGAKAFGAARLPRALSREAAGTASPKQAVNGEGDAGPGKSNAGDARSRSAGRRPGDRRAQPCRRPRSADRTGQAQLLQGPHDAPEFKFKPLARACG